jgi:hypothetical protein
MKKWRRGFVALLAIAGCIVPISQAQAAVVYTSNWGSTGGFGLNSTYWAAHKFTAATNGTITSIDIYLGSGSVTRLALRSNSGSAPGATLATMTSSTIVGTTQTFTGSFSMTAGTVYWLSAEVTSGAGNIGVKSALSDVSTSGWSSGGVIMSSLDSGATWGTTYVGGANNFILQMNGSTLSPLTTPNTPVLNSSTGLSLSVSETSATTNAVNYTVSLYQTNGTTLIETKTVTTITSPVTFTGLSAATNYKVSITANGDGSTYGVSSASPQLSVTTPGTTSVSLSGLSSLNYRSASTVTATVVGANGRITLLINGKRVGGCIKVLTSALSATCSIKPSMRGFVRISVQFVPTSASFDSSSNSYLVTIGKRSAAR